jgi:DNA-binding transcriptional LysR family regulator
MDLDLRLVRYFVMVATELHFGRAAARLHISQPALSRQIRKLEASVGGPLLVRDSRHVALTSRGQRFLDDARQLLAIADRMRRPPEPGTLRVAHIFELSTSRLVTDAYVAAHPETQVVERSMDSVRQLEALLDDRLDVAILRVTRGMRAAHPNGWHHRLVRHEPMLLVGRPGAAPSTRAPLTEGPVSVFADAPGSGLYNAHGEYLTELERAAGVTFRWRGNPGTFNHCYTAFLRSQEPDLLLEFQTYADLYAQRGLPVHRPADLRPVYPWSVAWRDEPPTAATAAFVETALRVSKRHGWTVADPDGAAPIWLPQDDTSAAPTAPGRALEPTTGG